MKKRVVAVMLTAMMAASLVMGCGNSNTKEESNAGDSKAATEETAKEDADADMEMEDTVVVYTAHPEEMLDALIEDFTDQTGIEVECLNLSSDLTNRIISEKDNPQADVIYGGDTSAFNIMKSEGCLAESNPSWAGELDDYFKDPDGQWYATIKTPVMMFYNTDVMTAEEAPKDWTDLADPKYKDKIILRGPVASSMCTLLAGWIDYYSREDSEDAAWKFVADLDNNVKTYDTMTIMQSIGKGDGAIGISTLNDIYNNVINNGMHFKEIYAESGNMVLADCVGLTKNAQHPNAGAKFLEYLGSKEVQAKIANDYLRLPTLDSALEESPEWMHNEIKALDVDWSNIDANKTAWVDKWNNEVINAEKVQEVKK